MKLIINIFIFLLFSVNVSYSYYRDRVEDYYRKYAYGWNKSYNKYGSNCANFVSQCLRAGCYSQIFDAEAPNEYGKMIFAKCSELDNFLKKYSIHSIHSIYDPLPDGLDKGDVVIWGKPADGFVHHAIIISKIVYYEGTSRPKNIYFAGNSTNALDKFYYGDGKWGHDGIVDKYSEYSVYKINDSPKKLLPGESHPEPEENGREITGKGQEGDERSHQSNIIRARDPNIMYGPEGYITAGQTLTYTVEFENVGEGIAYGVYITDTFDENLDDSTFSIGNFKRIDYNSGTLIETPATFEYKYDPATRTLAVFVDNEGELQSKCGGKFDISIKVKGTTPQGIPITNFATVYFPSVPEETKTNSIVSVIPIATQINYAGESESVFGDYAVFSATLTASGGSPASYKTVSFEIGSSSYTTMTDGFGVATIYPLVTQNPGNYTIKANFGGDGFYCLASQAQSSFEVIPDTGVLKVSSILPDTTKILRASEISNIKIYFNEYISLGSGKTWGDVVKITSLRTNTVLSGSYVYDETENVLTFTSASGFSNNAEYQIQIDKAIAEIGGYYFKGYTNTFKTLMLASQGGVVEKNEIRIEVPANALSIDGLVDVEKTSNEFKEKMVYPLKTLEEGLNYTINILDQNNSVISGANLEKPITIQAKYSDIVNLESAIERKKTSIYRSPWKASVDCTPKTGQVNARIDKSLLTVFQIRLG